MKAEANEVGVTLLDPKEDPWDKLFLGVAKLKAEMSSNQLIRAGAVIRNDKNQLMGWGATSSYFSPHTKAGAGCAEFNALSQAANQSRNGIIYCTHFPCLECAKSIIKNGIKMVVYINADDNDDLVIEAKKLFDSLQVLYRQAELICFDK